ncbi:MAG TPA: hypothetical protein VJT31_02425 [Rugosimonospora sp.]|nr:hypothetical protein [Rugosimonospora sp.]
MENRGRTLAHRGDIAIHSGLSVSGYDLPDLPARLAFAALGGYPGLWRAGRAASGPALLALGAVIAVAELVDVHPATTGPDGICCAPWDQARHGTAARRAHHLVLANVRALPHPVPCPGNQILPWDLPAHVEAAVRAQLAELATAHAAPVGGRTEVLGQ